MVRFLILSLFLSFSAMAAYIPTAVPQIQNGGVIDGSFPALNYAGADASKHFVIGANTSTSTNNNYDKFVKFGTQLTSQEGYQVTLGKTAYCSGMYIASSALVNIIIGYGTAASAHDTATVPTGNKQFSSGDSTFRSGFTDDKLHFIPISFQFPSQSFPNIQWRTASAEISVVLMCEEQ